MTEQPWFKPPAPLPLGKALVVGGGLAGCSVAHAMDQQGWQVDLVEASETLASAASGNAHAVFRPHLPNTQQQSLAALYKNCFEDAWPIYQRLCHGPLLQQQHAWSGAALLRHSVQQTQAIDWCGLPLTSDFVALEQAGWISIPALCHALVAECTQTRVLTDHVVDAFQRVQHQWQVRIRNRQQSDPATARYQTVILANGAHLQSLLQSINNDDPSWANSIPVQSVAGQTSRFVVDSQGRLPTRVICGKRFVIPLERAVIVGASFHRNTQAMSPTAALIAGDDAANFQALESMLPELAEHCTFSQAWRGVRATTPDRLPYVGPVPHVTRYRDLYAGLRHGPRHRVWAKAEYLPGLYLCGGFGSRGLLFSQFAARSLAAVLSGTAIEPHYSALTLMHPARFLIRQLVRGNSD